jgi:DNA-binding IclR family transcriptional regulator
MDNTSENNTVKTAKTTFDILETLNEKSEATVTELTDEFALSKSSIHNYLSTLERKGYVVKEDNRYRMGLRFLEFGGQARHGQLLYRIAKDEIAKLAEETGELANILIEEHGRGIYLYRAKGEQSVQTDSYTGHRVYLHNTALGKAILAHLPRQRVDEIIERHGLPGTTENTITDRDTLFEELERIRDVGIAFDDEARLEGLRCVAVPIINSNDTVEGAISISGPTSRFQGDYYKSEIPAKLKDAANVIELNITHT